ncbi:family 43 glycosylhydrolase [Candidatus Poribacteria bacterium]|nr:family 43 glycosylhydrolase [Candidatus Poribacteria bacterium]
MLELLLLLYGLSEQNKAEISNLNDIHLRDPFILPVPEEKMYYLFGTGWSLPDGPGFMVYRSKDLKTWKGPSVAFQYYEGFWSNKEYWAPEVHKYKDKYYMFASFNADGKSRGTQILVSENPQGAYKPLTEKPVTPENWECLDGTLFVDENQKPWIVFCHEWTQIIDGTIAALPLSDDLTKSIDEPLTLFKASDAGWVVGIGKEGNGKVTDGPFLYRLSHGSLAMLWSSFGKTGYCQTVAISRSGSLTGPWEHPENTICSENGGHGMLFHTFDNHLKLILHKPNSGAPPIPTIFDVEIK